MLAAEHVERRVLVVRHRLAGEWVGTHEELDERTAAEHGQLLRALPALHAKTLIPHVYLKK